MFTAAAMVCVAMHAVMQAAPVRFLAWDDEVAARKIAIQNAKGVSEIQDLHPFKRSAPADATGGEESPLELVALDRNSADGKPVTLPLKLAPGIKSPLVLILPDAKHPSGMRSFVIEDSSENFGWGTLRFINATGKELLVRQDKTIKTLPKSWTPVDISPGGQPRNTGVQIAAREDLANILYSAVWEHHPDIRKLIFVVPGTDVRTGPVEFKIIPEDRRAIAAEAALAE